MELVSSEVFALLVAIVAALIAFVFALFRRVKRSEVQATVEKISPEFVRWATVWAALTAYDAVEQLSQAYEAMSSEEKQKKAAEFTSALLDLLLKGKVSKKASVAMLESQIRAGSAGDASAIPEPPREALKL